MPPARLDHADAGVAQMTPGAPQEVGRGDEVGVEHRDPLAARARESRGQRAGLVPGAVRAVEVVDVHAVRPVAHHRGRGEGTSLVGRVVQHLDLEPARRPLERRRGVDQALDHQALVVDRELDRHHGAVLRARPRGGRAGAERGP